MSLSTFASLAQNDCAWYFKRLKYAAYVIVHLWNESKTTVDDESSVSKQEVRAWAQSCIHDTRLDDPVL